MGLAYIFVGKMSITIEVLDNIYADTKTHISCAFTGMKSENKYITLTKYKLINFTIQIKDRITMNSLEHLLNHRKKKKNHVIFVVA